MTPRWEYWLLCDSCAYTAPSWADADDHEARNPDHWVQQIQRDLTEVMSDAD